MNLHECRVSEATVEYGAASSFVGHGFASLSGLEVDDAGERTGLDTVLLAKRLATVVRKLNPALPPDTVGLIVRTVQRPPHPTLIENNRWLYGLLTDGVEVEYRDAATGENRGGRARLVDFDNPANNDFLVVRQLTVATTNGKPIRPDLIVYLNGLPLAVIELKDPTDEAADLWKAIDQLGRYMRGAPDLFVANMILVASDGLLTRVGSITSGRQRFMPWRPATGGEPTLEALIRGLFEPAALMDYLRSCVVFEEDERGNVAKKVAGYHQFRAVRETRAQVLVALKPPAGVNTTSEAGKGGVVWHTQGSGKSLTMLMLAGALVRKPAMANPTIVMVTDRNDLDDQLFGTFAGGRALLRQDPVQAESRAHLQELLDRASGGVIFTTIYKFTEEHGIISERANVVVMADEAHRSQYGFTEGGARWMREALPNATFVGFTGTPLDRDDRSTPRVFGEYADIYDIRQAVDDGATKPIYYESRIIKLLVNEAGAAVAEAELDAAANASETGEDLDESVRVPLEALVGAPERIEREAEFITEHWEKRRAAMEGKAMVVTMSREICMELYAKIVALRPEWHSDDDNLGFVKVVMDAGIPLQRRGESDDAYQKRIEPLIEPIRYHGRTKAARKRLAERYKDPASDLRLVIVCDMWLTGFDCPPMHTMYLDKALAGHSLMQAIARVNRVYGEKPGGLVVDLLGLADQLADALATYTQAGGRGDAVKKVQDEAVPAMNGAFEKLQAFFHGFDYERALNAAPTSVLKVYVDAANHVFEQDDGWKRFQVMVKELSMAFALVVPLPEAEAITPHLAFFQRIQAMIRKRLTDERGSGAPAVGNRDIDAAVRQVIGGAVDAGEVIDLFAAAGLEDARLDIFSEEFLTRVAALEQKNLALETLRKLLTDQIRITERTNLVLSKKFREALEDAMVRYTNKAITTAEMITRLLDLAKWVREVQNHGRELGLSTDEAAFYDAIAENESARQAMESDKLRLMARELAEMVKRLPKLDWSQRESVRADLRRQVRRLLARYGYPPDLSEDATQLVLKQAELSTANGEQ
jgi:type I restriction enzyme, R subunit